MFARIGGSRYLPNVDSPAREKHARLIAVGIAIVYALKHSHCTVHYDCSFVSRDARGMSFRTCLEFFPPFLDAIGTSKIDFFIATF